MITNAKLSDWTRAGDGPLIIAGPCSAESEEQVMATACALPQAGAHMLRVGIWKPRTRPNTFEGVGNIGLAWAKQAALAAQIPVAVEVANVAHVEDALKQGIDVVWIGARTTVNPFSVQAIADALRGVDIPVMVKNPVNPELELWVGALERLSNAGITKLAAIHRGFSTDDNAVYRNKPMWEIPIELKRLLPDLPLICDPSHICGNRELLLPVAQQAVDLDYDGLMIETHVDPSVALSDAKQQITPAALRELLAEVVYKRVFTNDVTLYQRLEELRAVIDKLDTQLLDVLAQRMEVSRQIGALKERGGLTIYQPNRWDQLVKSRTRIGKGKNLSEAFIFDLFQAIHQESIATQSTSGAPPSH